IDPSYELKEDFDRAPAFAERLAKAVPDALVLVWYPVLRTGEDIAQTRGAFHSRVMFPKVNQAHRMVGSGMVIFGEISENRRPLKVLDRALQGHFLSVSTGS
ncbi:MAG: hypothetical protein ACO3NE_06555, partial [Alphaproteobacteria bacterium]